MSDGLKDALVSTSIHPGDPRWAAGKALAADFDDEITVYIPQSQIEGWRWDQDTRTYIQKVCICGGNNKNMPNYGLHERHCDYYRNPTGGSD